MRAWPSAAQRRTWLARYRREAGVNQRVLSNATGISLRTLQRLESRVNKNPPVRYLISCALALELDDWHLLLKDEWATPLPGTHSIHARLGSAGQQHRP